MTFLPKQILTHMMRKAVKPHLRLLIHKRTFYEKPRAGYPAIYDRRSQADLSFYQRLCKACCEFKGEIKAYMQEMRSDLKIFPTLLAPNEHDIVWKFDGSQKSIDQWVVNCDNDYQHGYSAAKLELSSRGTGIFHGILDTRIPKDGLTTKSGYCNITTIPKRKSFKREDKYDWSDYNELVLKVRGDGRCYMLNILQKGYYDVQWFNAFHYFLYTRGGPYWQTVTIPFSKFAFSRKGFVEVNQFPFVKNEVTHFGITIADKKPGPFRLEIDYIAVSYNPYQIEAFAYEMYDVPNRN